MIVDLPLIIYLIPESSMSATQHGRSNRRVNADHNYMHGSNVYEGRPQKGLQRLLVYPPAVSTVLRATYYTSVKVSVLIVFNRRLREISQQNLMTRLARCLSDRMAWRSISAQNNYFYGIHVVVPGLAIRVCVSFLCL